MIPNAKPIIYAALLLVLALTGCGRNINSDTVAHGASAPAKAASHISRQIDLAQNTLEPNPLEGLTKTPQPPPFKLIGAAASSGAQIKPTIATKSVAEFWQGAR